jgi:alcohol dehydrogenase
VAISPTQGSLIFVGGTLDGGVGAIFSSEDSGKTWQDRFQAPLEYGLLDLAVSGGDPARVIAVDMEEYRLAVASRLGADIVIDASSEDVRGAIKEITEGWGAEYVIEAVGRQETLGNALAVAAPGGIVSVVGVFQKPVTVNAPRMLARNLTLTMGMGDLGHIGELVELIESGRLDLTPMITHRFPFDDVLRAYEIFEKRIDGAVKVLLIP